MKAISHSSSRLFESRLYGPPNPGAVLGPRLLDFGGYAVSLTVPGSPRMPNGVECDVEARPRDRACIGEGRIVIGHARVEPGPGWDPVPAFDRQRVLPSGPEPNDVALAAFAPGMGYARDCMLAGYVAGLVLLHEQTARAVRLAESAALRTDPVGATMLRHAALGEVPEPVHAVLATGEVGSILAFGQLCGQAWLRGLISAGCVVELVSGERATRPDSAQPVASS